MMSKAEGLLVQADDFHEKQVKLVEAGRADEAKENIALYAATVAEANQSLGDVMLEKKLDALKMESEEIDRAEEDSDYMKSYVKKNKSRMYKAQKGKRSSYVQHVGDSGYEVKRLQKALTGNGYFKGTIDGKFNKQLKDAVIKFQKDSKLKADGVAGPKTLQLLNIY